MSDQTPASVAELVKAPAARPGDHAESVGLVDGQSFALAQRVATLLSQSSLVPKEYQGNMPNCIIALNMAARIGADPMMVMQNLYVVHGRPGWSAQFLIATFNKCGRFSSLRYEFSGNEGDDSWGCRAWAVEKDTGERLNGTVVTIALAKSEGWYGKAGSKWKTMPQQMLMYRAASWFIRAYAPEIAMGLQTRDELRDTYDLEKDEDGAYSAQPASSPADDLNAKLKPEPAAKAPAAAVHTVVCPRTGENVTETECAVCDKRDGCPELDGGQKGKAQE